MSRLTAVLVLASVASAGEPEGACCLSTANCIVLTEDDCLLIADSYWAGPGTDCTDADVIGVADACELSVPRVYWESNDQIFRSNLDGTDENELPILKVRGGVSGRKKQ